MGVRRVAGAGFDWFDEWAAWTLVGSTFDFAGKNRFQRPLEGRRLKFRHGSPLPGLSQV
jgi:hypothetical protein